MRREALVGILLVCLVFLLAVGIYVAQPVDTTSLSDEDW